MSEKRGPLYGVKILDLTCVLSGPFGTSWLSDMGATVIKVENPAGGEYTRQCGPFVNGSSNYFATTNRNKKCVTLNLKDPEGKKMLLDMVKKVDVVTENFKPGTLEKLGIGYEVLKETNPAIVLASISGYGQEGLYSRRPGYDTVAQAMGAIMSITGTEEMPPLKCGPSIGDVTSGMNLVIGVLAALYRAKTTGQGDHVDVALVDSVLALTTQDFIDYSQTRKLPRRLGNNYSLWCPYGTYKAKDKYYTIGVGTEAHWESFCRNILNRPELITDPRFETQPVRVEHRAEVDELVNEWAGKLPVKEVVDLLNQNNIPAAPVYDFDDVMEDVHFTEHRQMIKRVPHPEIGEVTYINMPVRFREAGLKEPEPAGYLGQYNEEVYGEYLGLSGEDLARLKEKGTI